MAKVIEFNWDQWNRQKNEIKHGVSSLEAESAFFDSNYRLFRDVKHSTSKEERLILYARSSENRVLMIGFTIRSGLVRIITARAASKKERAVYEKEN
ncbi:MAG: BrnT family toxin [Proteobacteria bacterium]|nr:BrnT family toxin [Pseudomonadota bacterium]